MSPTHAGEAALRDAEHARSLAELLRARTASLARLLDDGTGEAVEAGLRERDRLLARLEPLLDRARAAPAGEAGSDALEEALRRLALALRGCAAADRALHAELERRRDGALRELVALDRLRARSGGYAAPNPDPGAHRVDLTR